MRNPVADFAGADQFVEKSDIDGILSTYAAVRLHSGLSDFDAAEAELGSLFSQNVPLRVPLVSAAMDTVTESKTAIKMALLGGIGVIHRGTPDQPKMAARVKHALHGVIPDPVTIPPDWSVEGFLKWRESKGFPFSRFPVCDAEGRLLGIVTGKDLQYCSDESQSIADIMTPVSELATIPEGTDKRTAYDLMRKREVEALPVVNSAGKVVSLVLFDDLDRIYKNKEPMANTDSMDRLRVAAAIGTGEPDIERAHYLIKENVDALVIDVAHAHKRVVEVTLAEVLRIARGKTDVVVGNVSNPAGAVALAKWGAQGIKIGQGPGSICTTRIQAGIGAPQAWAVAACARALREEGYGHIPVIADGGITCPGDIGVAIGLGAWSVMIGSLFAGTEETPGEVIYDSQRRRVKKYRGMGSKSAMRELFSAPERYGQNNLPQYMRIAEGVEAEVPFKGPLQLIFNELCGGLRQCMVYTGNRTIDDLRKRAAPFRISADAIRESHPHDLLSIVG